MSKTAGISATFPTNWRSLNVAQLRKLLEPWGTPYRWQMKRRELIRAIERIKELYPCT